MEHLKYDDLPGTWDIFQRIYWCYLLYKQTTCIYTNIYRFPWENIGCSSVYTIMQSWDCGYVQWLVLLTEWGMRKKCSKSPRPCHFGTVLYFKVPDQWHSRWSWLIEKNASKFPDHQGGFGKKTTCKDHPQLIISHIFLNRKRAASAELCPRWYHQKGHHSTAMNLETLHRPCPHPGRPIYLSSEKHIV